MTDITVADLDAAMALMAKHGVTHLKFRGAEMVRPPQDTSPAAREVQKESDLQRLSKLPPESQDAALMLQKLGGVR